jgi:hypothetical protein
MPLPPAPRAVRKLVSRAAVLVAGVLVLTHAPASAAPIWQGYAGDETHSAISSITSQPMQGIRWQTPVADGPAEDLIHFGSPVVTAANTVIVPVRQNNGSYRVEGRDGANGNLKWSHTSDYVRPTDVSWIPPYQPTLTPGTRLYYPGGGGSLYYRDAPDVAAPIAVNRVAFYGAYNAAYNAGVIINTPLTSDKAGNIYFGYRVVNGAAAPAGLQSGLAKVTPAGVGTWVPASSLGSGAASVAQNCAPALSPDGTTVYVATNNSRLAAVDSTTLAHKADVVLLGAVYTNSTASPTVGPDGDVYYGVIGGPGSTSAARGTMLHYSPDLSTVKPYGGFGWDTTPSVVPRAMVPSYTGPSSYLLMTKYNDYAGIGGGTGVNKLAILDPNSVKPGTNIMQEVLTIAGVTPAGIPGFPNAVLEWCINTAAVDPATKSVLANSEDGLIYRWDLTTNTLSESIRLTGPLGEAYTPTLIGADGAVYGISEGQLFSVGIVPEPTGAAVAIVVGASLLRRRRRNRPSNARQMLDPGQRLRTSDA